MTPSDDAEKNGNMGAQVHSFRCTTASKICWKIYFLMTLVRTNLFIPIHFLDYRCKIWQLLPTLYSDVLKKLYRCTSMFLVIKCCGAIFWNFYLYEVVGTNFSVNFWTFGNIECNFANIVAPPSNDNENCLVHLKGQSLLKETWNNIKIDS